jgi:ubiquinone/menaquinone biosynthesis C-methylase UbiE
VNGNIDLQDTEYLHSSPLAAELAFTPSRQTRRIYDILAPLYPVSTLLFHSRAHKEAIAVSGIQNGMRVLEVAIGSGEMFHKLVEANPDGHTVGVDLSPNMAARTQSGSRRAFPRTAAHCQAADARYLPFADGSFDALVCCYLLELLSENDVEDTVSEFQRVLRVGAPLTLILIGQNKSMFNSAYRVCTKVAPAFWGRQVERHIPRVLRARGFTVERDQKVRQIFYPSRVLVARNAEQA